MIGTPETSRRAQRAVNPRIRYTLSVGSTIVVKVRHWGVRTKSSKAKRTSDPKRLFGLVLRQLRLKVGLSQEEFAHQMGYHRNYIGQLERGEKSPSLSALFNFSRGLGLRPSELVQKIEELKVEK